MIKINSIVNLQMHRNFMLDFSKHIEVASLLDENQYIFQKYF